MKREQHFTAIALTAFLHAGLAFLVVSSNDEGCGGGTATASPSDRFANAKTIEASLAFKKVEKKNKQPEKKKKKKFAPPEVQKASRDENATPTDPDKSQVPVAPEEIDIASILKKNRAQDDDLSDTGVEEVAKDGQVDGSEWGTEKDARGDKYVAELKGRIYDAWKVPSLESGSGTAEGCVRLDKEGKIVDRDVTKKSKNANLNRSVSVALKESTDMEDPVPGYLVELLTVDGICFKFVL